MRPFARWLVAVLVLSLGAAALGGAVALAIRKLSLEYLVVVRNLPYEDLLLRWWSVLPLGMAEGFRAGLFAGALVGVGTTVTSRQYPSTRRVAAACLAALAVAAAAAALAAAAAYAYAKLATPVLPATVAAQVGRPYRALTCYGLEYGARIGGLLAAIIVGAFLWRTRRQPAPKP